MLRVEVQGSIKVQFRNTEIQKFRNTEMIPPVDFQKHCEWNWRTIHVYIDFWWLLYIFRPVAQQSGWNWVKIKRKVWCSQMWHVSNGQVEKLKMWYFDIFARDLTLQMLNLGKHVTRDDGEKSFVILWYINKSTKT